MNAHQEPEILLLVADREPVLDEDDAGTHQHALELGDRAEELLDVGLAAEAHDAFDAGTIVPAAVEQHDFAAAGQMGNVALEIPLAAFALGRRRQGHCAADARIEPLGDAFDHAALARSVAALEQHHHLQLVVDHPVLEPDELPLQAQEFLEVFVAIDALIRDAIEQPGKPVVVDL